MKTNEIKTNGQVRKDMGDLTELKASIKAHGIIQPLILDQNGILVAGHRRLQAAKELGLTEVPTATIKVDKNNASVGEIQLIENLQRKDLTPQEETEAYNEYLKITKKSVQELADSIGKTKAYVERRLKLQNLSPETNKALSEGKIELGHALLLCQLTKEQQKATLKEIKDFDLTVQNLRDQLAFLPIDFQDLKFRSNNPQKTLLDSVGIEVTTDMNHKSRLWDEASFRADFAKYLTAQRKVLIDKKIMVFNNLSDLRKKHPQAEQIFSHEERFNKIVAELPGSKKYALVVEPDDYDGISKYLYQLETRKEIKPVKGSNPEAKPTNNDTEKTLELNRKEALSNKISNYKRAAEIKFNQGKLGSNEKTIELLKAQFGLEKIENHNQEQVDECNRELKEYNIKIERYTSAVSFKKLMSLQLKDLKALNLSILKLQLRHTRPEDLTIISEGHKFNWEKDWNIDEEFLNLHSKDQLDDLCKELKIDLGPLAKGMKKEELIKALLKTKLGGKFPKSMGGRK